MKFINWTFNKIFFFLLLGFASSYVYNSNHYKYHPTQRNAKQKKKE
jgi:hypothetical protein